MLGLGLGLGLRLDLGLGLGLGLGAGAGTDVVGVHVQDLETIGVVRFTVTVGREGALEFRT